MKLASPGVSRAKVTPRKPSATLDTSYPDLQEAEELEERKPKSGIVINEEKGSFYVVYKRSSKPGGLPFYVSESKGKKKKRKEKMGEGEGEGEGEDFAEGKKKKKRKKRKKSKKREG